MEWKTIKNFDGYEANKDGEIRNKESLQVLSQKSLDKDGNPIVKMTIKTDGRCVRKKVCVHRIIAELFVENPNNLPYVKRKDNNKLNVFSSNLYWSN